MRRSSPEFTCLSSPFEDDYTWEDGVLLHQAVKE
jgi:hypothetical protein